jgi:hypothetical protein
MEPSGRFHEARMGMEERDPRIVDFIARRAGVERSAQHAQAASQTYVAQA